MSVFVLRTLIVGLVEVALLLALTILGRLLDAWSGKPIHGINSRSSGNWRRQMFKGWITMARLLGVFAVTFGVLGFGVTYSWVSRYLPEFQSGMLLCGLLVIAGVALLAASREVRKESPASLINLAASSVMVVALLAASSGSVALRLWWAVVIHLP